MPALEKDDEQRLVVECNKLGARCLKLRLASETSWPDRTILYRGRVMFVELKRKGERPTPLQLYTLDKLSSQGFRAWWSDDIEFVISTVTSWIKEIEHELDQLATIR